MTHYDMPKNGLIYNGAEIRTIGERLNLTDMWKAAGSPENREPFNWARFEGAPFIEAVALSQNLSVAQVISTKRGKNGGTEAHWQIGLAYAKYLSPEFHMWCNTVVRERMEGAPLVPSIPEELRRTDGISRMLAHKVTGLEKTVEGIGTVMRLVSDSLTGQDQRTECLETAVLSLAERVSGLMLAADARVAALEYCSVRDLLDEAGALQKGRNALNRRVGNELRSRALTRIPPVPLRRCPHSGVWLFPRDFANAYMAERGKALVSEHNARTVGQGSFKFPRRRAAPSEAANGNAEAKLQALSKMAGVMAQRIAGEVIGLTGEILSDALKLHRHRIISDAMKDGISYIEADGFSKTVIAQVRVVIGNAA